MSPLGIRILLGLITLISVVGVVGGARWYWITEGKNKCENAVAVKTQEKVVEDAEKIRRIRSYRPSLDRVAKRMLDGSF